MSEVENEKNSSSPLILMEGTLEKLKEREFPWILSGKNSSKTWVLRYYVLRHADVPDPDAFLLEQHEDCMPFSKVRKTLDLRRVLQVDTNISLKVRSQNWILAIHYKTKHGRKLKVLYLAAHSETEMNLWITKLCYACKLEKQDDEDRRLVPMLRETTADESGNEFACAAGHLNSRYCTDDSSVQVESVKLPTISTNNVSYADPASTHAYIRLKDCSSTHSLGSSSASLTSSITTNSSTTLDHSMPENLSLKNSFLVPPPIPPKPGHGLRIKRNGNLISDSGRYILDQPLTPPDISEVLGVKTEGWSNETVRPDMMICLNDENETLLSLDSSLTPIVSDSKAPKPFPRRRNFRNIPPEVDRSCKPISKNRSRYIIVNTGQEKDKIDDWQNKKRESSTARFLRTNPSREQPLHPVALQNKHVSVGQEALYGNESMRITNDTLDYLDPVREPLTRSSSFTKPSQRAKAICATEYTQIDEESTKCGVLMQKVLKLLQAVLEANVRQDELRRHGFSV
uniref:PH domain-containing protein n=1 Tax=Setaria digitata TaxID=48799 RepID=A0A915PL07_9BILA